MTAHQPCADCIDRREVLLNHSPVTLYACRLDGDFGITYISNGVRELLGHEPKAFVRSPDFWIRHLHPDDRDEVVAGMARVLAGEPLLRKYRFRMKNGEWRWMRDRPRLIRDDAGRPVEIIGAWTDITELTKTEDALRQQHHLLTMLINSSTDFIVVKDEQLRTVLCNEAYAGALGKHPAELYGKTDIENGWPEELVRGNPPKGLRGYEIDDMRALNGLPAHNQNDTAIVNGEPRVFDTVKLPLRDVDGNIMGVLGIGRDITERHLVEDALRFIAQQGWTDQGGSFFNALLAYLAEKLQVDYAIVVKLADHGQTAETSTVYAKGEILPNFSYPLHGTPCEIVMGKTLCIYPRDVQSLFPEDHLLVEMGIESYAGVPLWDASGNALGLLAVMHSKPFQQIEHINALLNVVAMRVAAELERQHAEQLIWKQTNFDPLTDLPNRRMFHDRLEQEIKKSHRAGLPMALMFIDLDRFKEVNDTLGHDKGDLLLKEAAQRLSACVRESDTVARLGGDEFTVILGELDDIDCVERIAQNILQQLATPFSLGQEVAYVSASIGITIYPEDATGIEALLKNADQAMYAAKNQGRNRFSYFTPSMQEAAQNRMRLAVDLRAALAENQLQVHYQPIVDLASGEIFKAEALVRWQHPTRGMISPAEFIPIAEESGLIIDIGDWVFHEAVRQVGQWRAKYHDGFQISVNKSPVQFHAEDASHTGWFDYLKQHGLPGQAIVVEITEGLLLDSSTTIHDILAGFRASGLQVALDDFGTGYSSLSYLKKFDIDYIKIDQSFVRNLTPDSNDMALCEAIIVMAHKLKMKVIAEGIETQEQRDLLDAAGCDFGQGYLFSKPVPAQAFETLLGPLRHDYLG